jgi:hypothetical protein
MQDTLPGKPVFIISLDVELAWGFILHNESKILNLLQRDVQKTKGTIDRLLKIFGTYNIPATWAVVGHLLLDSEDILRENYRNMPQFKEGWIDWDTYSKISNQTLYRGPELVQKVLSNSASHEIGLHSFFHLPFSKCSHEVAEAEITQGINAAQKMGISLKSFVFPENLIGHLDVLAKYGFQIYRSKDMTRYDNTKNFVNRKFAGAFDKIIAPPVSPSRENGIWSIPGSIYFLDSQAPFSLVPRVKCGLKRAIRTKKVFHIWLHPWNLLLYNTLERDLAKILESVAQEREKNNLQVMTMGEFANYLNSTVNN